MAFDGKPEAYTKPDVFSLEGLIAWLETQDGATEYIFEDVHDCLLCRYFKAHGLPVWSVSPLGWRDKDYIVHNYPWVLNEAASNPIGFDGGPITYAEAVDRCRSLLVGKS